MTPDWFVAAETKDDTWTVEAAIGLDQLTGRYPRAGDVWALGAQRVVPGLGFQSWSAPASTDILPEGFAGLLNPGRSSLENILYKTPDAECNPESIDKSHYRRLFLLRHLVSF